MSRIAFEVQFELATLDKTTRASIYAMHPIPVVYDFVYLFKIQAPVSFRSETSIYKRLNLRC
jgi:hypothetical protein